MGESEILLYSLIQKSANYTNGRIFPHKETRGGGRDIYHYPNSMSKINIRAYLET
jgi:hypothetical protein